MIKYGYLLFLLLLLPQAATAERARIELGTGLTAQAEYLSGKPSLPAVLILHGFLQTHEFPTVATLARGLNDSGYTVLSPTLSLGVPNRNKSLACEAVHRHSLQDDLDEIDRWVKWLTSRGHRQIVLMGHSFGSMQLLAYLTNKPDPAVRGFIAASLIETQIGSTPRADLIARLEGAISRGDRSLVNQPVSYCKKYPSNPAALLSYVRWDQARIVKALNAYKGEKLLVMGDADAMIGRKWLSTLQQNMTPMAIVKGAGHFMDGEHEFDLLEHSLAMLKKFASPHES
jgi:pimeloyl-ACP methyl ester carboxylesterase